MLVERFRHRASKLETVVHYLLGSAYLLAQLVTYERRARALLPEDTE